MGEAGKLVPVHTSRLQGICKCGRCRGQRIWTPERKAAKSSLYRAMVAAGIRFGSAPGAVRKAHGTIWLPQHDAALKDLIGTMDVASIAVELSRRFPPPRTETAVKNRVKKLRLSLLAVRPWTVRELARMLGVCDDTVRAWMAAGWLVGTPWKLGGGQKKGHRSQAFTRADVERFIRAHPDLLIAREIQDGKLRVLLEGLTRGTRWMTLKEASIASGLKIATVRWRSSTGKIPSAHKVDGRHWRISSADVSHMATQRDLRASRHRDGASKFTPQPQRIAS